MKTLGTGQAELVGRPGAATVNLIEISTFLDRDAGVVSTVFRLGEEYARYGGQQYESGILQLSFHREAMRHLPDPTDLGEGSFRKTLILRLRNATDEAGIRLATRLRAENLENASVEWFELLVDPSLANAHTDLTHLVGDEHLVRFRGDLVQVFEITDDFIELEFETREPQIAWTVLSDAANNDPRDLGTRLPVIYGKMKRVRAKGLSALLLASTTREAVSIGDTDIRINNLADGSSMPLGVMTIGNEQMLAFDIIAGGTRSTNFRVERAFNGTTQEAYLRGQPVFARNQNLGYKISDHPVSAIVEVYIFNPDTQLLVPVDPLVTRLSLGEFDIGLQALVDGGVFTVDRFEVFADVDGYVAPDSNYVAAQGALMEEMPDIMRHWIAVRAGLGHSVIDAGWDAAADATHLDDNVHALEANSLGTSFFEILTRMAYESRSNVVIEERASIQTYRLLVADNTYDWGASETTLTEWTGISIKGEQSTGLLTRFLAMYGWDPSKGDDFEAFDGLVRIDKDQNDVDGSVGGPQTAQLAAMEKKFGRRDADPVRLFTVRDQNTAREILGYMCSQMILRIPIPVEISDVPGFESYSLERGDIIQARPEWEDIDVPIRVTNLLREGSSLTQTIEGILLEDPTLTIAMSTDQLIEAIATASLDVSTDPSDLITASVIEIVQTSVLANPSAFVGGALPTEEDQPQTNDAQRSSVDFSGNQLGNTTEQTIGIANVWSISAWFKRNVNGAGVLIDISPLTPFESAIKLDDTASVFTVTLRDSAGVLFKDFDWLVIWNTAQWHHVVITWDGTNLLLYTDGIAKAADVKGTDIAGTMDDAIRKVFVASDIGGSGFFDGNIHSIAVLNAELDPDEVKSLWNHGAASYAIITADYEDYVSSASLKHWWRFGMKPSALGEDFAGTLDLT